MYCNTPNPAKRKALWVPVSVHNRGKHKKHAISYTVHSVDELKLRHHPDVVADSVQDCRTCRCMITGRRPRHVATRTLPPLPPPPPPKNGHHKHIEHEVRLRPRLPSMPKNWCRTASNGHTQAGATPPPSLPLCHAEERTTPGRQRLRLQGGFGARDVQPRCPGHVII